MSWYTTIGFPLLILIFAGCVYHIFKTLRTACKACQQEECICEPGEGKIKEEGEDTTKQ